MPRRSDTVTWAVAFVLVVGLGLLVIAITLSEREPVPPQGVAPSELSTGPKRPPEKPGDALVVVEVTSDKPMAKACLAVPQAVRKADREVCAEETTRLRRRVWVEGSLVQATANGLLGPAGGSARCEVRVDGRVERESEGQGPYKGAWCTAVVRLS